MSNKTMLLLHPFLILVILVRNKKVASASCNSPLGMKDSSIKDGQLSSKGDGGGTSGRNSRIENGGGWCSNSYDFKKPAYDSSTFLQIDLIDVYKITKLKIGGGSKVADFVPGNFAKLSYKVNQKSRYIFYKNEIIISGIKYPNTKLIDLVPPIITRYLKYQPQVDANSKCMTMELYGCPLYVSNCRKGIFNSSMSYTASATAQNLSPNYIAPYTQNFPWGPGRKSKPFEDFLDVGLMSPYLITGVQTFMPRYSKNILKQPDSFTLKYKYEEQNWIPYTNGSTQAIKFNTSRIVERIVTIVPTILAESIRISPDQSEKRFLKMQLYGCLLSDPTIFEPRATFPPTLGPVASTRQTTLRKKASSVYTKVTESWSTKGMTSYKTLATKKFKDQTTKAKITKTGTNKPPLNAGKTKESSNQTLVIVIVVLVAVLIFVIVFFLIFWFCGRRRKLWWRNGRRNGRLKANGNQNKPEDKHLLKDLSKNPIYEVSFQNGNEETGHLYAENGNEETGHLFAENGNEETGHLYAEVPGNLGNENIKPFMPDQSNSKIRNPVAIKNTDHSPFPHQLDNDILYTKVTVEKSLGDEPPLYADAASPDNIEVNPIYDVSPSDHDAHIYDRARGLSERAKIYEDPYQNVTGSSLYADPEVVKERTSFEIRKFPRERLRFLEKIGTGQFGEVHICEVDSLGSIIGSDASHCSWLMSSTIKVAVKMLKSDVEKDIEKEFMKEVRVMARLQHENVVQLLGVCDEDPKCMVVEYMENGDLNQFLKSYSLTEGVSDVTAKVLNEQTLLYMCLQISGGMKYLSSQGFVHRDLATRNCLVGHSFTVKISDFGMSRYLYSKHYYRIEGRAVLPIRWMAPESLFYGTFTSESDVWAFGVTLWEIFTFARETPYEVMSDQQVIENACSIVAKEQQAFRCLPRPPSCSDHVYKLVLSCWKKSPKDRPNFHELTQFFKRLVNSIEASI